MIVPQEEDEEVEALAAIVDLWVSAMFFWIAECRDMYGFALRPQHLKQYREHARIYKVSVFVSVFFLFVYLFFFRSVQLLLFLIFSQLWALRIARMDNSSFLQWHGFGFPCGICVVVDVIRCRRRRLGFKEAWTDWLRSFFWGSPVDDGEGKKIWTTSTLRCLSCGCRWMRRMCYVLSKTKMQICFGSRQTDTPERQKTKTDFKHFLGVFSNLLLRVLLILLW